MEEVTTIITVTIAAMIVLGMWVDKMTKPMVQKTKLAMIKINKKNAKKYKKNRKKYAKEMKKLRKSGNYITSEDLRAMLK